MENVDIFDEQGNPIGTKPYTEVDRKTDVLHCVQTLLLSPGRQIALNVLPAKSPWAGRLGTTVGTIVRSGEATEVAAARGLRKELGIEEPNLRYLGKSFEIMENGVKRWLSAYVCLHQGEISLNPEDGALKLLSKEEFLAALGGDRTQFSPSFLALYEKYHSQFPW